MALNLRLAVVGGLAAALVGGLALYGTGSKLGNLAAAAPCADASATVRRIAPLAKGDVAALDTSDAPRPAPTLSFRNAEGAEIGLGVFAGKLVLVNLWATWCAPCKAEMPALDRLQGELGGDRFVVAAINVETRNLEKPRKWLGDNGIGHLAYYGDPEGRVLPALQQRTGTLGLPTTLLIDGSGCEIGVMKGPADWASGDGKRLIRAALGLDH